MTYETIHEMFAEYLNEVFEQAMAEQLPVTHEKFMYKLQGAKEYRDKLLRGLNDNES